MIRILFVLLLVTTAAHAQPTPEEDQYAPFRPLINWFKGYPWLRGPQAPILPVIYTPARTDDRAFTVVLSDSALHVQTRKVVVSVPYQTNPYPVDYSVVYQGRLVSLFDSVGFVCLSVSSLQRDVAYEKKLNTKRFDYHWLLNGQLVGLSGKAYYYFDDLTGWRQYPKPVPLSTQPKLYEDKRYVVYSSCRGEFGGVLYFYDKQTQRTLFAEYGCAQSILHRPEGYYIVISSGHMMGAAGLSLIADPSTLPVFKRLKEYGIPEADSTQLPSASLPVVLFTKLSCQIYSGFLRDNEFLYVVNWGQRTFLASITKDTIVIKHPLFNDDLYTHNPVTTTYSPDLTVINLDFYGIGGEREIACLLLSHKQVVKLSWNFANDPPH